MTAWSDFSSLSPSSLQSSKLSLARISKTSSWLSVARNIYSNYLLNPLHPLPLLSHSWWFDNAFPLRVNFFISSLSAFIITGCWHIARNSCSWPINLSSIDPLKCFFFWDFKLTEFISLHWKKCRMDYCVSAHAVHLNLSVCRCCFIRFYCSCSFNILTVDCNRSPLNGDWSWHFMLVGQFCWL